MNKRKWVADNILKHEWSLQNNITVWKTSTQLAA